MTPAPTLFAPSGYWELSPAAKQEICNGCGTKGLVGYVIPDRVWGLGMSEACNIHDYMYAVGETENDRCEADNAFLNNMLRLIAAGSQLKPLVWLRRYRAMSYYSAVRDLGGPAFWNPKNKPEEMQAVAA